MTGTAKITGTRAEVNIEWELSVSIEPGCVPDRPARYSTTGRDYRPDRLHLKYSVSTAVFGEITEACPEADDIRLTRLDISGARLRKDGTPGDYVVTEHFYLTTGNEIPDWARAIADANLAALKENAL